MTSQALKEEFRAKTPNEAKQDGWAHLTLPAQLHAEMKQRLLEICIDSNHDELHEGYGVEVRAHTSGIIEIGFNCTNPDPNYFSNLPGKIYIFRNSEDSRACRENDTLKTLLLTIARSHAEVNGILEYAKFKGAPKPA